MRLQNEEAPEGPQVRKEPPDDLGAFSLHDVDGDDRHATVREVGRITGIEAVHAYVIARVFSAHEELLAVGVGCRAGDLVCPSGQGPSVRRVVAPSRLQNLPGHSKLRSVWQDVRRKVIGQRERLGVNAAPVWALEECGFKCVRLRHSPGRQKHRVGATHQEMPPPPITKRLDATQTIVPRPYPAMFLLPVVAKPARRRVVPAPWVMT